MQQVLIEAEKPLVPDDLFRQAGLKADVVDDVDEFCEELREEVRAGRIEEVRPDDTKVLLKASEIVKYQL